MSDTPAREIELCTQSILSDIERLRNILKDGEIETGDLSAIQLIHRATILTASQAANIFHNQQLEAQNVH